MEKFVLKVAIDDSQVKALEQILSKIAGITGNSSSSSPNGGNAEIVKNIIKLGVIATGVGGLITLVKKISEMTVSASPMLQAMLKLFDTSLTLILRPIGDFIGFTLRPILIYFLLYVALPFYRYFTPFMQKYGNALGQIFASPAGFATIVAIGVAAGLAGLAKITQTVADGFKILAGIPKTTTNTTTPTNTNTASTEKPNVDTSKSGGGTSKPTSGIDTTTIAGKTAKDFGGKPIDLGGESLIGTATKVTTTATKVNSAYDAMVSLRKGLTTSTLSDAYKMIAGRIAGGDFSYGLSMVKLAPKVLKAVVKNLPELGILVAAITGDPSWILPGYGGQAGETSIQQTLSKSMPTITSRFTGNNQLLPQGFEQHVSPGAIGNPSFTINVNAGTVVDKQGLADLIKSQVQNQVPQIVQNSLRRTITR